MASAWITGARGFIGRYLSRWMAQSGFTVLGLGHGNWSERETQQAGISTWLMGDVTTTNLRLLGKTKGIPELVFHLAGGSSVPAALANPLEDFARTVVSTANLLEWLRVDAPHTKLLVVSSAAVYGTGHS